MGDVLTVGGDYTPFLVRVDRQEPSAVISHAGICSGGPPPRAVATAINVSTSGYYEWCDRPLAITAERRDRLKVMIARAAPMPL